MILRAILAIAVAAIAAPYAPRADGPAVQCRQTESCSAGLELLDRIRAEGLHSLAEVRGQIEAAEKSRAKHG